MASFVDLSKIDDEILRGIEQLLSIRAAARQYAGKPDTENSAVLISAVEKFGSDTETLRLNLAVMVKQANDVFEDAIGRETENGVEL